MKGVTLAYKVDTISDLIAYSGKSKSIYVSETDEEYALCDTCIVDGSAVLAGSGGRKWRKFTSYGVASISNNIDTFKRSGNAVYDIIDQNTGQYMSLIKVTTKQNGDAYIDNDVNNSTIFKISGEYFMRPIDKINVEWFRTSNDDWQTLKNAFTFVEKSKYSYTQFTLVLPEGKQYGISQPLTLNTSADVTLIGGGLRKSSIYATANMAALLILGGSGFTGRCHISGITFFDNNLADVCVDARGTRYSVFEKNEFVVTKANGTGMRINNWVQNVYLNLFTGVNNNPSTALIIDSSGSSNNFNVERNSFSDFMIGVKISDISTSINILKNSFDNCYGTGLYISAGSRGISVENNYFEACGDIGIPITKGAFGSPIETWKGAIIAHHDYRASSAWINGLAIKKNQFANCSDANNGLITLSGINYCEIESNFTYLSYSSKYFVDLRWQGVLYTQSNLLKIDHSPSDPAQFTQLVGLNADDSVSGHSNIVIRQRDNLPWFYQMPMPIFDNPYLWDTSAIDAFHEETRFNSYNGFKTINYRGTADNATQTLTINVAVTSPSLLDKYYRVNWLSKGISADAGFILTYKVDGVSNGSWSSSSIGSWVVGGKNATIYIPKTATNISFEFQTPNGSDARLLSCFSISPCSYDLSESGNSRLAPTEATNDIYYNGGNPNGNQYARIGRLCLSINDGKLYKKTTSYSSNTGWQEIKDASGLATIASPVFTGNVGIDTGGAALSQLDILFANGSLPTSFMARGILAEYYGVGAFGGKGGSVYVAGGTKASPSASSVNDVADISALPLFNDGTKIRAGAHIDATVSSVAANTSIGSFLRFWIGVVTGDAELGSSTGLLEAMRLTEAGNLLIGTTTDIPCSIFTPTSTSKGILLPRMTKAQRNAISSPVAGLAVYQTDNTAGLRVYNGTNWIKYTEATD